MEHSLNGDNSRPSEADLRKGAESDLAEIRSLGLVDRAHDDFSKRIPGAIIEGFKISYFVDTNVVWCDVSYKLKGSGDSQRDSFFYKRTNGTNWNLTWFGDNER